MKICLLLSFYDESPTWLAAVVAGFGRVADEIVAVDGAYALYPGARARSHPQQAEAIIATAEALGIGCTIRRPKDVFWGNEVEKRQLTLDLAAPLLTPGEDWVLVVDGDYLPLQIQPEIVRHELENTDLNVASYTLLDTRDFQNDPGLAARAVEIGMATEWTSRTRDVFRWTPDLRYGPAHFTMRGTYNGEELWVRGPEAFPATERHGMASPAPCHDLNAALVVYHRTEERPLVRREASHGYYKTRDQVGIEKITPETVAAR